MIRPIGKWLIGLAIFVAISIAGWVTLKDWIQHRLDPEPETIVSASLQGLRAQNRLSTFAASYVAVATTAKRGYGMEARKTLIMPGFVQYEVDMAKIDQQDLAWDNERHILSVTLPLIELAGPQIDMTKLREYDNGSLLLKFENVRAVIDQSNRVKGQRELLAQARGPLPMGLAREATRRAVESNFALPLRAAGLDASVRVRFRDEAGFPVVEAVDGTKQLNTVYGSAAGR